MPAPGKSLGAICPVAIQNNKPSGLTLWQNSFINKKYCTQSEHIGRVAFLVLFRILYELVCGLRLVSTVFFTVKTS